MSTCSSGGFDGGVEVKKGIDVAVCVGSTPTVKRGDVYPGGDYIISVPGVFLTTRSEGAGLYAAKNGSKPAELHLGGSSSAAAEK